MKPVTDPAGMRPGVSDGIFDPLALESTDETHCEVKVYSSNSPRPAPIEQGDDEVEESETVRTTNISQPPISKEPRRNNGLSIKLGVSHNPQHFADYMLLSVVFQNVDLRSQTSLHASLDTECAGDSSACQLTVHHSRGAVRRFKFSSNCVLRSTRQLLSDTLNIDSSISSSPLEFHWPLQARSGKLNIEIDGELLACLDFKLEGSKDIVTWKRATTLLIDQGEEHEDEASGASGNDEVSAEASPDQHVERSIVSESASPLMQAMECTESGDLPKGNRNNACGQETARHALTPRAIPRTGLRCGQHITQGGHDIHRALLVVL